MEQLQVISNVGLRLTGLAKAHLIQRSSWTMVVEGVEGFTDQVFLLYTECPKLVPPENGSLFNSRRTIGSFAVYFCNNGYVLVGKSFRQCLQNGMWSNNEPFCQCKALMI